MSSVLSRRTNAGGGCSVVVVESFVRSAAMAAVWEGLAVLRGRPLPSLRSAALTVGIFTCFVMPYHLAEHGCLLERAGEGGQR
mmetsp:Transcript_45595/g.116637  ORF Transcript_45595/g.116637 Transcript_45595/m.116637 type:complete len:83 (-) Transcript_45595:404-652(-)